MSELTLKQVDRDLLPATPEQWDRAWASCEHATFFESRTWAEVWKSCTNGRMQPDPRTLRLEGDRTLLLPLSREERARGLATEYHLCPGSTFGGWLGAADISTAEARRAARLLLRRMPNLVWRLNPYDASLRALDLEPDLDESTRTLALDRDPEDLLHAMSKGHRSAISKARREGVQIQVARSIADWREYFQVYRDSLRRWGDQASSMYEWPIFEALHQCASPHVRLWVAAIDDRIIAGAVCLSSRNLVVYWHGAALEAFFKLRPTNLLLYEAIRDAHRRGKAWFDFNPSGRHDGVDAFKRRFGAVERRCPVVRRQGVGLKAWRTVHRLKHAVAHIAPDRRIGDLSRPSS